MSDNSVSETDWLRYPRAILLGDAARAAIGLCVALIPLLFAHPAPWLFWLLGLGAFLFLIFALRTGLRALSRYRLEPDGLVRAGPRPHRIAWDGLRAVKLRYYATKRNRSNGWFVLTLKGADGRLQIESTLPEFETIAARAFLAAEARGLVLDMATLDNFAALGLRSRNTEQGLA